MRYDDNSSDCAHWTSAKLFQRASELANLTTFSNNFYDGDEVTFKKGWANQTKSPSVDDFCREQTRIYRASWLAPVLEEIGKRLHRAARHG